MLFCLTADYTHQSIQALQQNPTQDRRQAANQLLEAAGGKIVSMHGTVRNGPGVLVIFDVPDPQTAPAITEVLAATNTCQNIQLMRLVDTHEITTIRQKAKQLQSAYQPPGR